jgi:hypothetical protein
LTFIMKHLSSNGTVFSSIQWLRWCCTFMPAVCKLCSEDVMNKWFYRCK